MKAKIALALLILGMSPVLLNCSTGEDGETPAATASPATSTLTAVPKPTGTPVLNPTDSPPPTAAHSCNLMDMPYDALMTGTTPFGETRVEIRFSGGDEHIVMTTIDHKGVLFGKGEMIIKDRTMYSRESTQGNAQVYGEWRVHGTNIPRSFSLPCLDPSGFEEDASSSSDEPHFTS